MIMLLKRENKKKKASKSDTCLQGDVDFIV
jgi:hypothetical protein